MEFQNANIKQILRLDSRVPGESSKDVNGSNQLLLGTAGHSGRVSESAVLGVMSINMTGRTEVSAMLCCF